MSVLTNTSTGKGDSMVNVKVKCGDGSGIETDQAEQPDALLN